MPARTRFNCSRYGIFTLTAIPNTAIASGNLFIVPGSEPDGSVAVYLQAACIFAIVGNSINSGGGSGPQNGFVVGGAGSNGVITGNSIVGTNAGIWLQAGATAVNVQSNLYLNNGQDVVVSPPP